MNMHPVDRAGYVISWTISGEPGGVLEWSVNGTSASARYVTDLGVRELDKISGVSVAVDGALIHVDCGPALNITVREQNDGSVRVLYARTSMLARLGVPGGAARVAGCGIERSEPVPRVVVRGRISSS